MKNLTLFLNLILSLTLIKYHFGFKCYLRTAIGSQASNIELWFKKGCWTQEDDDNDVPRVCMDGTSLYVWYQIIIELNACSRKAKFAYWEGGIHYISTIC